MTPYILASTLFVLVFAATATRAADPPKGRVVSETIVATWRCQDKLPQARTQARSPWKHHSAGYWAAELNLWNQRLGACRAVLARRAFEWNWQAWLPRNWYLVGSCESGYGGDPNWFHSNRSYVSAFGIQRGAFNGAYDSDAHKVGMPGWDEVPGGRPSPWQQYKTALSHYHSFGDGWGCPGP